MPLVQDHVLTLGGLSFHYRDWGNPAAPPLVLLHGYTGNARQWDKLASVFADHHRVLALDQRGHGETDWAPDRDYAPERVVEDFAAFVAALGLTQFPVVAFSFGCDVAVSYAATYPSQFTRMVLVEVGQPPDTATVREQFEVLRGLPADFASPEEAVLQFAATGLVPFAPEEELHHWVVSGLDRQPDGRWRWRLDPVLQRADPEGRERLTQPPEVLLRLMGHVRCPTLLVRGAASELTPIVDLEQMAAILPDARIASLPEAGHWTPLDNPNGFIALVRDFLAEV
jgi:pimeloyl-ACP methyl ester carboxylesterase